MRSDSTSALTDSPTAHPARRLPRAVLALGCSAGLLVGVVTVLSSSAAAATAPIDLGQAIPYSVVAGQTVTNTGPSVLSGSLGVSPGTAITGFPPGLVGGSTHAADGVASQVQSDIVTSWIVAAGRAPTAKVAGDIVGRTLTAGVYKSTSSLALSGTLTLNAQGNPDSVFIFQIASTLITATASRIAMINGAQPCHVYWQVGSSATLGTTSVFKGTILALTSITVKTGATVEGRALARNGAVTLDNNVFTTPGCDTTSGGSSPTSGAGTTPAGGSGGGSTPGGGTGASSPGAGGGGATTPGGGGGTGTLPAVQIGTTPTAVPSAGTGTTRGSESSSMVVTTTDTMRRSTPHTTLSKPRFPATTGSNVLAMAAFGLSLMLLGGAATLVGRRTRRYGR
jgi:hypothetical protein